MKNRFLLLSLVLISVSFFSCGDDASDCSSNFIITNEIQSEISAWSAAAQTFALDQTTENCNAYKQAGQDYVDAIEDLQDCANDAGQGAEFTQFLADAQQEIDDIQC